MGCNNKVFLSSSSNKDYHLVFQLPNSEESTHLMWSTPPSQSQSNKSSINDESTHRMSWRSEVLYYYYRILNYIKKLMSFDLSGNLLDEFILYLRVILNIH